MAQDIEESVNRDRFIQALRDFADAVEAGEDFTTTVKGQQVTVPVGGRMQIEWESDNGSGEYGMEIEW